jgi:hypothetical protein
MTPTAMPALLYCNYQDGEKRYILHPAISGGRRYGATAGPDAPLEVGNALCRCIRFRWVPWSTTLSCNLVKVGRSFELPVRQLKWWLKKGITSH